MDITQQEFEQLPKEEQNFRWALFMTSNGYTKVIPFETIRALREKYLVRKEKLDKNLFEEAA
jgi:hypothetical protein